MEPGGSLPHSQQSTTCPYPSQINAFIPLPITLVSVLVGLRTYQHPGMLHAVAQLVLTLHYRKVAGSIRESVTGIFH